MNDRSRFIVVDTFVKRRRIESEIGGVFFQIGFGECAHVLADPHGKQFVVVLPELALLIGAFCGFGGPV